MQRLGLQGPTADQPAGRERGGFRAGHVGVEFQRETGTAGRRLVGQRWVSNMPGREPEFREQAGYHMAEITFFFPLPRCAHQHAKSRSGTWRPLFPAVQPDVPFGGPLQPVRGRSGRLPSLARLFCYTDLSTALSWTLPRRALFLWTDSTPVFAVSRPDNFTVCRLVGSFLSRPAAGAPRIYPGDPVSLVSL